MPETEIQKLIDKAITAHEFRVGIVSGAIGGIWLGIQIAILVFLFGKI